MGQLHPGVTPVMATSLCKLTSQNAYNEVIELYNLQLALPLNIFLATKARVLTVQVIFRARQDFCSCSQLFSRQADFRGAALS